jgi:serine/threonine-protein kinase
MHPRLRAWMPYLATGAFGFMLAFGLVAVLLFPADNAPQEVRVPSVMGLPIADAERRLRSLGLAVTLGEALESADAPKNTVVAQSPVAGETINAGDVVVLDVSQGQDRATIPAVVGMSRDEAERLLTESHLAMGEVAEQASDTARGIVLAASPAPGTAVPRGTQVNLLVSSGPVELSLPDVVGRDVSLARSTLEQIGLVLAPLEYDSLSSLAQGTVVAQTPAAGSSVTAGSPVTLRVSGRP